MPATRFRKKPVEIEAMQFTGIDTSAELREWLEHHGAAFEVSKVNNTGLCIAGANGYRPVFPGGYVVRLPDGYFEVESESSFAEVYEPVERAPEFSVSASDGRAIADILQRYHWTPRDVDAAHRGWLGGA